MGVYPSTTSSNRSSLSSYEDDDEDEGQNLNTPRQNVDIENMHISEEDKESIVDYWKKAYSDARDGEELSEYDVNEILDFLDTVKFKQYYTSSIPSDEVNHELFTETANIYDPKFRNNLNPNAVPSEYVALCNQANDAIESYLFVTGRFD